MYLSLTSNVSVKKLSSFILVHNFELQLKHEMLRGMKKFQHVTAEVSNSFFLQNHIEQPIGKHNQTSTLCPRLPTVNC